MRWVFSVFVLGMAVQAGLLSAKCATLYNAIISSRILVRAGKPSDRFDYYWLDTNHLLLLRSCFTDKHLCYRLMIYDLKSGSSKIVGNIHSIFRSTFGYHSNLSVSNNGKWVLWNGNDMSLYVAEIGVGRVRRLSMNWRDQTAVWMPDSRHILVLGRRYSDRWYAPFTFADIYSANDQSHRKIKVNVSIPIIPNSSGAIDFASSRELYCQTLGMNPVRLTEYQVSASCLKALRKFTLYAPEGDANEAVFDRRYHRIAWLWLSEFPSAGDGKPLWSANIGIERFGAKKITVLGSMTVSASKDGCTPMNPIYDLKWDPDGKRISFIFQGSVRIMELGL